MKTLSIRQPWAWAILHLKKPVENRTWKTKLRERVMIHAGKKYDHEGADWIRKTFKVDVPGPKDLPLGGLVGSVEIVDCVSSHPSPWFCGPYGFVLKDPIEVPYQEAKGRLGFFNVEEKGQT